MSEADDDAVAPARAVRMKDIAEHLGLSQTTVSHVLTGKHQKFRISAATVDRVWKLIRAADDGGFELDMRYFEFHRSTERTYSDRFVELFGA